MKSHCYIVINSLISLKTLVQSHALAPKPRPHSNVILVRDEQPSWCKDPGELQSFLTVATATPNDFNFPSYCSEIRRPTQYVYFDGPTIWGSATKIITTTTWPTITKTISGPQSTATLLCPSSPISNPSCSLDLVPQLPISAQIFFIDASPQTCQQQCLSNPKCKSFLVVDLGMDNLNPGDWYRCVGYSVSISKDMGLQRGEGVYRWYEKGCGELLPQACFSPVPTSTLPPHSTITTAPLFPSPSHLSKRQFPTLPESLATYWGGYIDLGCSCVISGILTTKTVTEERPTYLYSYTTTTTTRKRVHEVTEYPGRSTIVSVV